MRVLSVPQPFAQLVVRGVKRLEVRSWEPGFEFPVRLAIHASVRAPARLDCEEWFWEREPARAFAEQGWVDRRDLTALPRGAIIGTVTLAAVHVGADVHSGKADIFAWNHETARMEVGERDPQTGALRVDAVRARVRPLGVAVPADSYVWVFTDPVEFEPITGVEGKLRTWALDAEMERVVVERELRARKRLWRPEPVDATKKAKAVEAWRELWQEMRAWLLDEVESDVRRKRDLRSMVFSSEVEAKLREHLDEYFERNKHPRRADWVYLEAEFRPTFGNMEIIPRDWFELEVRRRMKTEADAQLALQRRQHRRDAMLKIVDEAGPNAITSAPERAALFDSLAKALDKMLEEEAEDIEFAKRQANPRFEARMERARLRQMTRRPTDPSFDLSLWNPLLETLLKSGFSDDEVAAAMAWEQLKTRMLLEGEG